MFGDYTKKKGIDGSAEAIKEAIKPAFGLRTRMQFWLEDEDEVVNSLYRDMPPEIFTLHFHEGMYFATWKQRVRQFIEAIDPRMSTFIEEGPFVPMCPSTIDPNLMVPKKAMDMTQDELDLVTLDHRAHYIIISALDDSIFMYLLHCKSAKEMWDSLTFYMEGTEEMREIWISILNQKYDTFRQEKNDSISDCYEKFFKIVNGLRNYGSKFTNYDLNDKFLRSLNKKWDIKICAIREMRILAKIEPQNLFEMLLSHEVQLNTKKAEKERSRSSTKEKFATLKADSSRRTMKSQRVSDNEESGASTSGSDISDMSDEEYSLFVRKFKKMMVRRREMRNKPSSSSHSWSKYSEGKHKKNYRKER